MIYEYIWNNQINLNNMSQMLIILEMNTFEISSKPFWNL